MKTIDITGIKLIALSLAWVGLIAITTVAADDVSNISKEQLEKMLDNPDVIILDVRNSEDWQKSKFKIKGAVRRQPKFFDAWAREFPRDKALVLY